MSSRHAVCYQTVTFLECYQTVTKKALTRGPRRGIIARAPSGGFELCLVTKDVILDLILDMRMILSGRGL